MDEQRTEKKLLIIGAGGLGREIKWLIERINTENRKLGLENKWQLEGFIDDGIEAGTLIDGLQVLGDVDWLEKLNQEISVVCAIGNALNRTLVVEKIKDKSWIHFPNLIDPSVILSNDLKIGKGNVICAGCSLTVNITIHDFSIINPGCTVGHDTVLGNAVTIYPGANVAGNVTIGDRCELGTGCHVIQGITISTETIVGAGAVVIRNLPGKCTAVGNPAKVIKYL